jgi:uncharacterized membrane protein YccC
MHKKTFERLRNAVFEAADEEEEAYYTTMRKFAEKLKRQDRQAAAHDYPGDTHQRDARHARPRLLSRALTRPHGER